MSAINYTPTPTGQAFIQSLKKYTFVVGPVGSAKTTASLFKVLYHAKRQRPSPRDGVRRSRFAIIRSTNRQLFDTTLKSFFQWFPAGAAGEWQATQKTFIFRFDDVYCEVLFRPLDSPSDVSNVLSLELTGAMFDEFVEIPREIVDAVESRTGRYPAAMDGGCSWKGVWGASNSSTQDCWWYDWLYEEWPEEEGGAAAQDEVLNFFEQPSGFSPAAENLENLPPYIAGDNTYYVELAKGKTPDWIKQFIEVQWGYSQRGKPVYKAFNRDLHVAKQSLQYNPHLPVIMGFDAGLTPAAVFAQQDGFGRVLVLAELVSDNMGAQRFCREKVKPLLNRMFPNCRLTVVADPATKQRAQTDEKTVASVLEKELGVKVKPASSNTLSARLGAVDEFLTRLTEAGPALLIDPTCKNAITGFVAGYRYALNSKGVAADAPEKNHYSHCFVAGTLVTTARGDVPIETVAIGDLALTPNGYKPVLATMNSRATGLLRLAFSDGAELVCTADHPFVTERGTILARELTHDDILFSINRENTTCHAPNTLTLTSKVYGSTPSLQDTSSLHQIALCTESDTCTALCGCTTTDLCRTSTTSTTSTTTRKTTASATSNCSVSASICLTTARSDTRVTLSPMYERWMQQDSPRPHGTVLTPGESGTGSTVETCSPTCRKSSAPVLGAESSSPAPQERANAGSVQCPAKAQPESHLALTMLTRLARTAAEHSAATNTTKQQHVARLVRRDIVDGSKPVYDLTVADEHVFYANGVLVGNCHDAIQYMALGFTDGAAREARARKHNHHAVQYRNPYAY